MILVQSFTIHYNISYHLEIVIKKVKPKKEKSSVKRLTEIRKQ